MKSIYLIRTKEVRSKFSGFELGGFVQIVEASAGADEHFEACGIRYADIFETEDEAQQRVDRLRESHATFEVVEFHEVM